MKDTDLALEMLYGPPLTVVSECIRGMIIAPPGYDTIAADFSNIEGRGLAWLAGEDWKMQAFRDYDAGTGPDLYKVTASEILGKSIDAVTKDERQSTGKVPELACGYQGSTGAFQKMAVNYGLRITDREALAIVKGWRSKNSNIVSLWKETEAAAIAAVQNPGQVTRCAGGRVKYRKAGSFLFCQLPSGRCLSYPYPRLVDYVWTERKKADNERESRRIPYSELATWRERGWTSNGEISPALHYKYVDPLSRKWVEGPTYGGSLVENITQAMCRDIMAEAMQRVEKAGYEVVLTVHDEIIAYVKKTFGSLDEFVALLIQQPVWAAGMPIAAEGWRGHRYRK